MMSLHRKLGLLLLIAWCAPLYVLVRYFYGRSFFGLVLVALAFNLLGLPYLVDYVQGATRLPIYPVLYNPLLNETLALLALYVLPIHILWMVFYRMSGDTRYDLDSPGRVPIPFVHPWIADGAVALAAPYLLLKASTHPPFRPYVLDALPLDLPVIGFDAAWIWPAVTMAAAYALAAILSAPALDFRFEGRVKRENDKGTAFDVATVAEVPARQFDTLAEIHARRSPELAGLVDQPKG